MESKTRTKGSLRNKEISLEKHSALVEDFPTIFHHLSTLHQEVLTLRFVERKSLEQVADAMHCSNVTAQTYLKAALFRAYFYQERTKEKQK